MQSFHKSLVVALLFIAYSGCSGPRQSFPETERKPVADHYFGTLVVDDYRWLDNVSNPAVRKWIDAQNAISRAYLDTTPWLSLIRERLQQLNAGQSPEFSSLALSKKLFALKSQPPKNHRYIVVFDSPADSASERVVVDPEALDSTGTTAIDWYVPSRDGRLVAVSLSRNGSEDGSVHVFDVATQKEMYEVVPRVQYPTAGGTLEWDKDGKGFYYTRYPQGNERPPEDMAFFQQVYYHKLGTPSSEDSYVIGKDFPRIAEIKLSSSDNGKYLLVRVANGDGGDFMHWLRKPDGSWIQLTQFSDRISSVVFGEKGVLYLLSRKDAPHGKILSVPLAKLSLADAKTVVAETEASIADFIPATKHIYVFDMGGGPSQVRVLDLGNGTIKTLSIPPMSSVDEPVLLDHDELLFHQQTYFDPPAWWRYNPSDNSLKKTSFSTSSSVSFDDAEVVREFAPSKDGTKIPLNIMRLKGTVLNGKNPTILYGYGGYGLSEVPEFRVIRRLWLDQGGIYAIANLRGGGEFGEEWHEQGKLTKKQNVFDDFEACAEHLINTKYTDASELAIEGASNGGLLMGAALTQRPELFRAVVSRVGIYDMLRVELFPNGAFNVTEYGSVKDSTQFTALYAYSPYHHVIDGKAYPAVLFMTGDHDGRVDPANSRKMVARLQAATRSNLPVLLRTDAHAGHGFGTSLSGRTAQDADMYAFLLDQLGVTFKRK